jgi:hypothetical protein
MSFFYNALKCYHNAADHGDRDGCEEVRQDALHLLAMMASGQQLRLHAPLLNGFRRISRRCRAPFAGMGSMRLMSVNSQA